MSTAIEVAVHLFQRRGVEALRVCLTRDHVGLNLPNEITSDDTGLRAFHRALQSLVLFPKAHYVLEYARRAVWMQNTVEGNKRPRKQARTLLDPFGGSRGFPSQGLYLARPGESMTGAEIYLSVCRIVPRDEGGRVQVPRRSK